MIRCTKPVIPVFLIGLLIAACQNDPGLSESPLMPVTVTRGLSVPPTADIDSAQFFIYVTTTGGQRVSVNRISADWDETNVTWNNFNDGFSTDVAGSFAPNTMGWYSIDLTSLVESWLDGTWTNHGFMLNQDSLEYPVTSYFSSDNVFNKPFMRICYTDMGNTVCESLAPAADAFIFETFPDSNFGDAIVLFTGRLTETVPNRRSLIKFSLPVLLQQTSGLGDFVWNDTNMNGIQDENEDGIPDVTVKLFNCADSLLSTTTTDIGGFYLFDGLTPGDYYLQFVPPPGLLLSPSNAGSNDTTDSDADSTGKTACITLGPGEMDVTWDAGLFAPAERRCTRTIGYWKNHAGFGPQDDSVSPLLPIWLGDENGGNSIQVNDAQSAVDLLRMKVYGDPSNGITKLYAQMLAAKLNMAGGASAFDIIDAIVSADAFLAQHDWHDWDSLEKTDRVTVLEWKSLLDDYNNGVIGPGHCDE